MIKSINKKIQALRHLISFQNTFITCKITTKSHIHKWLIMLLTTQDQFFDGNTYKTIGIVSGNTVRTRHVGAHFRAGLKVFTGGEVDSYTVLLSEARQQAMERMIAEAQSIEADAIVAIRFSISNIAEGISEVLVTGTAVQSTQKIH